MSYHKTSLIFSWTKGDYSRNDCAIIEFKKNAIPWRYDHYGRLQMFLSGAYRPIEFEDLGDNIFRICVAG